MKTSALLCALLSTSTTFASTTRARSPYAVKETHFVPRKWSNIGAPHESQTLSLSIGLRQGRFAELEQQLYEVSDPEHERYGKHLTKGEVDELVRPSEDTSTLVEEWLLQHGISRESLALNPAGDWVTISLPVQEIERLLDTKYSIYEHEDGSRLVRTTEWSLPQHLHDHISTIQPTTAFLRVKPNIPIFPEIKRSVDYIKSVDKGPSGHPPPPAENVTGIAAACNFSAVTPTCLRTLYDTIDYVPKATDKNSIGINNFLGEVSNRTDTTIFLQKYRPEAVAAAFQFPQISINGGPVWNGTMQPANVGLEGNLDIETVLGSSWPTPVTVWSTGGSPRFNPDENTPTDTNEPYLAWAKYAVAQTSLPGVITTSYGDDEQTVPESFAKAVCSLFAQIGARGTTLLVSSGDDGVGTNGTCLSNDGKNTTMFIPNFPASCPYVTTVGGTKNFPEIVAFDPRNGYASGGGFSNYFERPSYQDVFVPNYIASLNGSFNGLYNNNGRGYPDIAAQGYHFITIYNGSITPLDGTSCASPTAASVLGLVNDALIAAGKPKLGFLNPWLYKTGYKTFTDVVSGSAIGCNETGSPFGFPAKVGWDAVTGFGTPNFLKLLAAREGKWGPWSE